MSETEGAERPAAFITSPPRRVLFLCIHNSARSQMAEGFARAMAPADAMAWSAGSQPTQVHPLAIQVMMEAGIDISDCRSKRVGDVPWQEADTVVTLCAESDVECPSLGPTVRRVHWPLPDPVKAPPEQLLEAFRETRDEIRWRSSSLWPHGD
jgi:arsenate reductase